MECRPDVHHQLVKVLSRAPNVEPHGEDINDCCTGDAGFTVDNRTARHDQLLRIPIIDGVYFSTLRDSRDNDRTIGAISALTTALERGCGWGVSIWA